MLDLVFADAFARLLHAFVLGAVVGAEREFNQHPAGLRTHILVSVGAAVFTLVSISTMGVTNPDGTPIPHDPGRIAAQIVTGIGFIGGGAVLREGANVRGVTTAASLWITASIGMLAACGYTTLAWSVTGIVLVALAILGRLEHLTRRKSQRALNRLRIDLITTDDGQSHAQNWIDAYFQDEILNVSSASEDHQTTLSFVVDTTKRHLNMVNLSNALQAISGVQQVYVRMYYQPPESD